LSSGLEQQVSAELELVHGVLVLKGNSVLFGDIQSETQAGGVDPAVCNLAQAPYRLGVGQGICDQRQVFWTTQMCEAVALLAEGDVRFPCSVSNVLMTVEDDLCPKRLMARHLDNDVAPLRIHDVERVIVDESVFLVSARITPFVERFTSHTGATARATKIRNTPRLTVWVPRYSSAS
jgi:hypothetical protein